MKNSSRGNVGGKEKRGSHFKHSSKFQHGNVLANSKNKRRTQPRNRKSKLHIQFDEADRREYVTGFRKRKRARKEKALAQLKADIKAEIKRAKNDRMEVLKKLMRQGEDLSQGLKDEDREEDEEMKGVTVSRCGSAMVEIKGLDLTSSQNFIGTNQVDKTEEEECTIKKEEITSYEEDNVEEEEDISKEKLDEMGIHSKKDLHRSLKMSTASVLKKSSARKKMQARDAQKQRKANARKNKKRKNMMKKKGKKPRQRKGKR